MDYYAHTDEKVAAELGLRLKRLRERRGYSKLALARAIGEPVKEITVLEKGRGSLATFIAVLRQLRAFDQLDRFLMETRIRALELTDPRLPSEGTVMYHRRKSDFNVQADLDTPTNKVRRKSDSRANLGNGVRILDHKRR